MRMQNNCITMCMHAIDLSSVCCVVFFLLFTFLCPDSEYNTILITIFIKRYDLNLFHTRHVWDQTVDIVNL